MRINLFALLAGERVWPEGFTVAIGKRLTLSAPGQVWQYRTDPHFFFNLEYIRATWGTSTVKNPISDPRVELYRDLGARAYQDEPNPLILTASPGASDELLGFPQNVKLNASTKLNLWYDPSSVIYAKISGYAPTVGDEDFQTLDLCYFGRYYNRSEAEKFRGKK